MIPSDRRAYRKRLFSYKELTVYHLSASKKIRSLLWLEKGLWKHLKLDNIEMSAPKRGLFYGRTV